MPVFNGTPCRVEPVSDIKVSTTDAPKARRAAAVAPGMADCQLGAAGSPRGVDPEEPAGVLYLPM
jgi:hypothetical protein